MASTIILSRDTTDLDDLAIEVFVNEYGMDLTEAYMVAEAMQRDLADYAHVWDVETYIAQCDVLVAAGRAA